jgi:hypothetical protein
MILNATPVLHFALDGPRSTTRVVATPRGSQLKRQPLKTKHSNNGPLIAHDRIKETQSSTLAGAPSSAQRTEALLGWAKTIETTTTDVSLPAWSLLIRGAGGNRARFGGLHESREDGPRYRWGGNVAVRASVRRISRQK